MNLAQHIAFYGITQSGKTTAARHLARKEAQAGRRIIVFDPVNSGTAGGGWPENSIVFSGSLSDLQEDPNSEILREEFTEYLLRGDVRDASVYVDESDYLYCHSERHNFWHLRRGRHKGLYFRIISQRPTQIHPTVRAQCSVAFCFSLTNTDITAIAADYGIENITGDNGEKIKIGDIRLDPGDFLLFNTPSPEFKRGNIFSILDQEQ